MKKHFQFTAGELAYLQKVEQEHNQILSQYASKDGQAIRKKKVSPNYAVIRPAYAYDVDLIIHNMLYNRYGDKTQVFSFYKNDDLTRRALHVQFVSKIARTIGRALRLNLDLIEAISLGHDMGHTPFGHKGEMFLSKSYQEGTLKRSGTRRYFNHNVHSVRTMWGILDMNLTLQTLSGVLAHNGEKVYQEYRPAVLEGIEEFEALLERCYVENDFHKQLRPNTLEGCVVRISDMIAYAGKDRQDLFKAGLVDVEFEKDRLIGTSNSEIISRVVVNLIKNSIDSPSLNFDKEVFDDLKDLINENYDVIYEDPRLNEPYFKIIKPLMKMLYDRLVEDVEQSNYQSPVFQHHLNNPILGNIYRHPEKRYLVASPDDIVADFIASMTDDYFIDICRELHLNDKLLETLKFHGYFE